MDQVRAIIARYPVQNARFFGSTSRGDDRDGSDLDILVEPTEVTTLFDLAGLKLENTTIKSAQTVAAGAFTPPQEGRGGGGGNG